MSDPVEREEGTGAILAPEDDPRPTATIVAGVVGVVATVLIILGLEALHYRTEVVLAEESFTDEPSPLGRLVDEQREMLRSYRWVDRERGIVSIPIERAMELVAAESTAQRRGGER
jgi:hypothetical protein